MDISKKIAATIFLIVSLITSSAVYAEDALPDAESLGLVELTDDLSRQELFQEVVNADPDRKSEYQSFAVKKAFKFPSDVNYDVAVKTARKDSLFGVDISHHNGKDFPIELLETSKSIFVYMKASQGATRVDPQFADFWSRAGNIAKGIQLHRGAYHFLSSGESTDDPEEWGIKQAKTFIRVIKANGGFRPTDMPPAVDVEWDKASVGGPDRWKNRKPADVIAIVRAFSNEVERGLGRKPVIYTARSWWVVEMGGEATFDKLSDHKLWIADYSSLSQSNETPKTINKTKWAIWQFTDAAQLNLGSSKSFDASIYKGDPSEFYSILGVREF